MTKDLADMFNGLISPLEIPFVDIAVMREAPSKPYESFAIEGGWFARNVCAITQSGGEGASADEFDSETVDLIELSADGTTVDIHIYQRGLWTRSHAQKRSLQDKIK